MVGLRGCGGNWRRLLHCMVGLRRQQGSDRHNGRIGNDVVDSNDTLVVRLLELYDELCQAERIETQVKEARRQLGHWARVAAADLHNRSPHELHCFKRGCCGKGC